MRVSRRRFLLALAGAAAACVGLWRLTDAVLATEKDTFEHLAGEWRPMLASRFGDDRAAAILSEADGYFDTYWERRPRVEHPALDSQLAEHIVPAAALYSALRDELDDPELAYETTEALFVEVASGGWEVVAIRALGVLPDAFGIWAGFMRRRLERRQPPEGYEIEWVADADEEFAFTMHRCFHADAFTALGVPALTRLSCRIDLVFFDELPDEIRFERETTIGDGGASCPFRFVNDS